MKTKSSLGSDAVKLTLSKMATLVINMIATMLISRYRTVEEYGTYSQLILVVNLFSTLFMLGLPNSINYFLARANTVEEANIFLSNYYSLTTILSIILGGFLAAISGFIVWYFDNELIRDYTFFLILYPWATITMNSIDNIMIVYKKINTLMIFKIIYSVALVCIVLVNHFFEHGFSQFMLGITFLNISAGVCTIALVNNRNYRFVLKLDKKLIHEVILFSIPLGVSTLIGTLNTEIDKLYIGYVTNTENLAVYTNAAKELPIYIIASSVSAIMMPQIIQMIKSEKAKEAVIKWKSSIELSFIVTCFLVCGIFVYSKEAMMFLYSEKYLSGVTIFRIYTLNLLLRVTYFGMFLNALGRTKKILASSVISLAVNVILNPVFFCFFGMIGPAIATFIAILTMQFTQLLMTSKLLDCSLSKLFPISNIITILCINVIFGFLFDRLKVLIPLEHVCGEINESLILGVGWGSLYFYLFKSKIAILWKRLNHADDYI